MPQIVYRANLASAQFPILGASAHGQTVIVGGPDQNFSRQLASRADQDRSVGIPQVFAVRNCLPVDQGYASVRLDTTLDAGFAFPGMSQGNSHYPFVGVAFGAYVLGTNSSTLNANDLFRETGAVTGATIFGTVSLYILNGIMYGYTPNASAGPKVYTVNFGVATASVLVGAPANIVDATSCFGYHLLITNSTFYWSSLTNPLDFVPSLVSGAGNFSIQQAQGALLAMIPARSGVYVVCEDNIVFLRYTGNPRFPFAAQPVEGIGRVYVRTSGTAIDVKSVFSDRFEATDIKYVLTSEGFFEISPTRAAPVFPEFMELYRTFISRAGSGGVVTLKQVTKLVSGVYSLDQAYFYSPATITVENVRNKYLTIKLNGGTSSGSTTSPIMFVYDFHLQRWGTLEGLSFLVSAITGSSVSYTITGYQPNVSLTSGYRTSIEIEAPENTNASIFTDGSLVMGRYQHVRGRMLELQSVDIQGGPPTLRALCSLKGDNVTTAVTPSAIERSGRQTRYFFNGAVGFNISLLLEGRFNVTSAVLNFNLHGKAMYS